MSRHRHIPGVVAAAVTGAALAVTGAVAFACTNISTISLPDPGPFTAGETITGTGTNFSTAPGSSAVQVHFNAMSGSVVWSGRASSAGSFTFSFAVPNVAVGYYFIGATQTDATGHLISSSNTRLPFNVVAPPPPPPPAAAVAPKPRPVVGPVASKSAGSTRGLTPPQPSSQSVPSALAPAPVPAVYGPPAPIAQPSVPAAVQQPVPAMVQVPAPAPASDGRVGRVLLVVAIALGAALVALAAVALRRPRRRRAGSSAAAPDTAPIIAWAERVLRDVDAQRTDPGDDGVPVGYAPSATEAPSDRELEGSRT